MAIEVVILAPVLIAVMMLIVGLGRYVDRRGDVEAMARDAVRSASLQRDVASARQAAQAIVDSTRPDGVTCAPIQLGGTFAPGEMISVRVSCQVSFGELGFAGFPGSATLAGESFAPIDELRGTL
ncbi:pilus assembly protein [Jiangella aurantiaca]|uniref:Pilus assembly protein n=1 Tax=Jiangella aurantiaca TaxID=2530373 RepID=A0A4R5AGT3_9ACTN|nr:TadE family protein [Jiangella aurantiaca]TDD69252.1 pilus assembly protein [Jiangella aurantiaca]